MFVWRLLDRDGHEISSSDRFADRPSAESWLSDRWPELLDRGVEQVDLMDEDDDHAVYRMALRDETPS